MHEIYRTVVQDATATISASRPAYLLLDNVLKIGSETEIVKVTAGGQLIYGGVYALAIRIFEYCDFTDSDPATCWRDAAFWMDYGATTVVRGQLGTTAVAHKKNGITGVAGDMQHTQVWDITCEVDSATKTLNRFKYGCPIVEFETHCHKMPLQQADCVTLVYPGFVSYGKDGVTTSTTWEIVSKELDPMASPPRIKWRLAMNTTTAVSDGPPRIFAPRDLGDLFQERKGQGAGEQAQGFAAYGFVVTVVSGRQISISSGAAASGMRGGRTTARTVTLPASRDSYAAYDPATRQFEFADVANGAAAPSKKDRAIWIAKVVTNATDVVLPIVDLRETLPFVGSKLKAGSGPLAHLEQLTGVLDNVTSITARSLDNITDGATYLRVTGVSAGNQVQAASIATNAVEEAKINAGAVTEGKIGALAVTEGKIGALAITEGKLGASAVTSGKIGANAVTAPAVAANAIAPVHIAAGTLGHYIDNNATFIRRTRG
jgi:hypothetical protein